MVVVASAKLALRMVFAGAIVVIALIFFAGKAHADDTSSTATDPTSAATTPAVDNTQSTLPPSGVEAEPTPSTPAGAPGPDPVNNQDANVGTSGTGVANTGANSSTASGPPTASAPNDNSTKGKITTGPSDATGTNDASSIDQGAHASTSDQGAVDILQIALVVNVGVANSNSGHNAVGANGTDPSSGSGSVKSHVGTGNTGAIGDVAKTGIKQHAVVGNDDTSAQKAVVVNVGIAFGNSGLNITIGTLTDNGQSQSGQAVSTRHTRGKVTTGAADAIGDQSTSAIDQDAKGTASGTAVLTIDQRAIVVNFGTAFANTGGNLALASFDPSLLTPEEAQIVAAVLSILGPLFTPQAATAAPVPGTTVATIATGDATALGNAANTTIDQSVIGHVHGDSHASASEMAEVGNLGLALANSGFNGAFAGSGIGGLGSPSAQLLAPQGALSQFLAMLTNLEWLNSANPFAQFQQSIDIGGVTLDLGGTITGDQFLVGWDSGYAPDGGPLPGGVRVRQISGVLNIGISMSDTGNNTVVAIVTATHAGHGAKLTSSTSTKTGSPDVLAQVMSGTAAAIGNNALVTVCQSFHDTAACAPKHTPVPPPDNPTPSAGHTPVPVVSAADQIPAPAPAPPAMTVSAAESTSPASLPFTGGADRTAAEVAGALLALGGALASRRRRASRV